MFLVLNLYVKERYEVVCTNRRWTHTSYEGTLLALKEKSALCDSGATYEIEEAKFPAIEHHLTLERVERMVGDVSQGSRKTAHAKLLHETRVGVTSQHGVSTHW